MPSTHSARPRLLFGAICALGISAITTQLVLMRELLCAYTGNELVFGVILGSWLLIAGLGSWLGVTSRYLKDPLTVFIPAQIVAAMMPLASVYAVRTLRNVVFIRGVMIGPVETIVSSFVVLLPYCLITGYLLTLACQILASDKRPNSIGRVYFLDVLGDIIGGLLFTFLLVHYFNHFQILYFTAILNLVFAVIIAASHGKTTTTTISAVILVAFAVTISLINLDEISTTRQYAHQNVVYHDQSPYGRLVVTEQAGQYNFIENGITLFSSHDIEQIEETVHFAMAQQPEVKHVLLIGGGASGTIDEILKYPNAKVTYVEFDPEIIDATSRFLPDQFSSDRIELFRTDGRRFIRTTGRKYNIVIIDMPDPASSQINRYYTREFFSEAKRALSPGGVLSISAGHYENYVSDELASLIASTRRTLAAVFEDILVIPAGRIYFIASDGELHEDIAQRVKKAGITTHTIKSYYIDTIMAPDRLADINRGIGQPAKINTDFNPVLYYYHLRYWLSQFNIKIGWTWIIIIATFLLYYFYRMKTTTLVIFTTGLAASSLEIVLLLSFQVLFGSLYHQVGMIVTMFMIGLAMGGYLSYRMSASQSGAILLRLEVSLAIVALVLPMILYLFNHLTDRLTLNVIEYLAYPLVTILLATLVGMEFPQASKLQFDSPAATASRLYTADYLGACLGALLAAIVMIPVLGMTLTCAVIFVIKVFSAIVLRVSINHRN